jgi:hypothetical protein
MTCSIALPNDFKINIDQDITFENFVSQFQQFSDKILCIVNGTTLHFYDKNTVMPNVRYEYKQRRGSLIEYYFRDMINNNLYCVFGRDNAVLFYPNINQIEQITSVAVHQPQPKIKNPPIISNKTLPIISNKDQPIISNKNTIVIYYKGKKLTFTDFDYENEIKTFFPKKT